MIEFLDKIDLGEFTMQGKYGTMWQEAFCDSQGAEEENRKCDQGIKSQNPLPLPFFIQ